MKKTALAVAAAMVTFTACVDRNPLNLPEPRFKKSIVFEVFKGQNYTEPAFDNTTAEVRLTIARTNKKNWEKTTLWDTTIMKPLREFDPAGTPLRVGKTYSNVSDDDELYEVSRTVRYRNGNTTNFDGKGESIDAGNQNKVVVVRL